MTKSKQEVENLKDWKTVKGFSWFLFSADGQVYDIVRKTIKPQFDNGGGYMQVNLLNDEGIRKRVYVHRMVYQAFKGPIPKGKEINHIDENKANNCIENLEAVTHTQNQNHGSRSARAGKSKRRPVAQYTPTGKLVRIYDSMTEATEYGYGMSRVCACCNGRLSQYKGYVWKYAC